MKTSFSFSFQARPVWDEKFEREPSWITSAGRWDSHEQAVKAAAEWLIHMAGESPQEYQLQIVQIEELELIDG